jgi:hypothetical protein
LTTNTSSDIIGIRSLKAPATFWTQPQDWANSVGEDISVANIGTAGGFQTAAVLVNSALKTAAVVRGINATHPGTLSVWRSSRTVKVLLGNLETVYCATPKGCAIPVAPNAEGGWIPGVWLDLVLELNPAELGVAGRRDSSVSTEAGCDWRLNDLTGMQRSKVGSVDAKTGVASFAVRLAPREARIFELSEVCCTPKRRNEL